MKSKAKITSVLLATAWCMGTPATAQNAPAQNGYYEIQNDCFWDTADGKPLYTQGGGIFRFPDPETGRLTYYWYGNHYREVSQTMAKEPHIEMPDGQYTLQFHIKNAGQLQSLQVQVTSGGKTVTRKLDTREHDWQSETLQAQVRGGQATVTFHIEGKADSECRIDDVLFTRAISEK